ncbi:hypothetical protein SEA_RIPARIAN_101 [Mycobacterium phage Riparian]|uniref:Uncharacterized protein n=1 Tax=Mycobacterium phage Riparian TaxID=2341079 RepID=A0A3G3LWU0_9CAUD|nr:hypothetical protein SEA_RIPARIAN_101 [Mycobacterium phage Riparian]
MVLGAGNSGVDPVAGTQPAMVEGCGPRSESPRKRAMSNNEIRKCHSCGNPRDNASHETLCPVCLVDGKGAEVHEAVCENFVGKREWGIGPVEPWRRCVNCGWPKAQHVLPSCTGGLTLGGLFYPCELNTPHDGWGHSNKEAQAIWQ